VTGDLISAKKLRDGTLLITTANEAQSAKLLAMDTFNGIPVKVQVHRTLNTCRGVITNYDLLYVSDEEIKSEMASQGVIDCRRLKTKRNGELINSTSVILTFSRDTLPEKVFVGYESVSVRPFIPSPMRCFQCQRFGHIATRCEGKATCPRCGREKHDGDACTSAPFCVNCEGPHPVYSRDCPKMKDEKKIMEIKTVEKLPYSEARKKFRTLIAPTFSRSYASVVHNTKNGNIVSTVEKKTEEVTLENEKQAKQDKATKPASSKQNNKNNKKNTPPEKTDVSSDSSKKKPNSTPITNRATQSKRGNSQSPGPSGLATHSQPESMEEDDECISESEIIRARAKEKRRIKR
jgi:type II secretory pathway pseudopilin PulG